MIYRDTIRIPPNVPHGTHILRRLAEKPPTVVQVNLNVVEEEKDEVRFINRVLHDIKTRKDLLLKELPKTMTRAEKDAFKNSPQFLTEPIDSELSVMYNKFPREYYEMEIALLNSQYADLERQHEYEQEDKLNRYRPLK